ncbi:hypothetical protein [Prosthecobacter sp.]|uniref:hypothetical protein n=1 Tax=Prosthecobacter sp. TaxID=1965333 RepID=UPI001E086E83|nr:hypothetical protein [Prosthecobacter sp.]MCB1275969.1 hypothetical protein [Prosthecobacter sp.]
MLLLIGRIYTALSFALPLATLVVSAIWIARFKENGPQSAGLGPLMVGALTVLGVLTANAVLAGLLAWSQPACRTSFMLVALLVFGLLVAAALFWWLVGRPG